MPPLHLDAPPSCQTALEYGELQPFTVAFHCAKHLAPTVPTDDVVGDDVQSFVHCGSRDPSARRASGPGRHRAIGGERGRFVRQCPGRVHHRAVQDGGDSTARPLARPRAGRVRDTRGGSTGSTIGGSSKSSGTDRRRRPKRRTIANASGRCWPRDSTKTLSGKPGAVQTAIAATAHGGIVRATRKPPQYPRTSDSFALRCAERRLSGLRVQEPPRRMCHWQCWEPVAHASPCAGAPS